MLCKFDFKNVLAYKLQNKLRIVVPPKYAPVRHNKVSGLVLGLALRFMTGMVNVSPSFCHGGPLLWRTQTAEMTVSSLTICQFHAERRIREKI
jgi:hypothetical protein